ncbi:MAG: hypothetical protein DI564_05530 [Rhodanobacter denitrificans]|uniref:DUF466 domain-containing protein n=1 Tax=Rhodanobacter denitrificans TaxID=666685 RepID=A0A2W5KNV6_9GAMM|nr:MAG: hypothetical protein DI564_05530 [Rhodanobacter denitrificans]
MNRDAAKAPSATEGAADTAAAVDGSGGALTRSWRRAVRIARQIIGIPDYGTYVAHLRAYHPDRPIPTYAEFFNERLEARYKGGGGRCC